MVVVAARAGIHRRHERKVGRILDAVLRPRDHDALLLERLAQHLEDTPSEFGQLVEEQHAVVGQRHLARTRRLSAADQRHLRGEVVRSPEGAQRHQSAGKAALPGYGMDLRRLEGLLARQRREDRRQTPRQHRLARTRGADHQHVVASGRSDLQRPLDVGLPLDIGEILGIVHPRGVERILCGRKGRRDRPFAVQVGDDLAERGGAHHLDPLDHGRLGGILRREDQPPQPFAPRRNSQRKHPAHGSQRAVERQLADEHRIGHRVGRDALHRREDSHGDRQIESRPLLAQVGRSQAHNHLAARHPFARVLERRPDALFALLDGVVRKPHQIQT